MSHPRTCPDCHRTVTKTSRGLCTTCYSRRTRQGIPLPPLGIRVLRGPRVVEVLEDVTWLADNGVGLTEAAHRVESNPTALQRFLERHGHVQLLTRLRALDPVPAALLTGAPDTVKVHHIVRGPGRGTWKVA